MENQILIGLSGCIIAGIGGLFNTLNIVSKWANEYPRIHFSCANIWSENKPKDSNDTKPIYFVYHSNTDCIIEYDSIYSINKKGEMTKLEISNKSVHIKEGCHETCIIQSKDGQNPSLGHLRFNIRILNQNFIMRIFDKITNNEIRKIDCINKAQIIND